MTGANWHIRPILIEAAVDVYPVHVASFAEDAADHLSPAGFLAMTAGPGAFLLAAHAHGAGKVFAGYVLFRRLGDEAELLSIAVKPDFRGKGLGKALVKGMLDALRDGGPGSVFLEVECDNRPAIRLYEGFGFVRCGTRKGYYRSKNGKENDALIMKIDIC